jgi:chitinase
MHHLKTLLFTNVLATLIQAVPTVPYTLAPRYPVPQSKGLTVYWGVSDTTTTLADVCADNSYDIVVLSFVHHFFSAGGYPSLDINLLDGPSPAQKAAGATALQDGTSLIPDIRACQSSGKRVLMSLGGALYHSNVDLKNDYEGEQIADTLWNLFGGGTNGTVTRAIRPFGDVKLDGFDIGKCCSTPVALILRSDLFLADNESGHSRGYAAMVRKLRANFKTDPTKQYYLSAAPMCAHPDDGIPTELCSMLDYVWIQFYNSDNCNVGQDGFKSSVEMWSAGIGNAQLRVGAIAAETGTDRGYVPADTLVQQLQEVEQMGLPNYGGAMLWEAQLAVENGDYQKTVAAGL